MDLKDMMSKAMKMAESAKHLQAQVSADGTAGGGMVTCTVGGDHSIRALTIDPAILDPPDPTLLQDLIVAAVNQAQQRVGDELRKTAMSQMGDLSQLLGDDP